MRTPSSLYLKHSLRRSFQFLTLLACCTAAIAPQSANASETDKETSKKETVVTEKQTDYSYKAAFKRAQRSDQPLVVIVTATWCAPCQVMKNQTIKQVMAKDGFENVILAFVDVDQQPALAQNLTKGKGIPHVVVFEKKETKWKRRTLFGVQTADTLQAFIKPRFDSGTMDSKVSPSMQRLAGSDTETTIR